MAEVGVVEDGGGRENGRGVGDRRGRGRGEFPGVVIVMGEGGGGLWHRRYGVGRHRGHPIEAGVVVGGEGSGGGGVGRVGVTCRGVGGGGVIIVQIARGRQVMGTLGVSGHGVAGGVVIRVGGHGLVGRVKPGGRLVIRLGPGAQSAGAVLGLLHHRRVQPRGVLGVVRGRHPQLGIVSGIRERDLGQRLVLHHCEGL